MGNVRVADAAYAGFNGGQPQRTGQTSYTTDVYGRSTTYKYDVNGRLLETDNADGTRTQTVYDASGRAILTTDGFLPGHSLAVNLSQIGPSPLPRRQPQAGVDPTGRPTRPRLPVPRSLHRPPTPGYEYRRDLTNRSGRCPPYTT